MVTQRDFHCSNLCVKTACAVYLCYWFHNLECISKLDQHDIMFSTIENQQFHMPQAFQVEN